MLSSESSSHLFIIYCFSIIIYSWTLRTDSNGERTNAIHLTVSSSPSSGKKLRRHDGQITYQNQNSDLIYGRCEEEILKDEQTLIESPATDQPPVVGENCGSKELTTNKSFLLPSDQNDCSPNGVDNSVVQRICHKLPKMTNSIFLIT